MLAGICLWSLRRLDKLRAETQSTPRLKAPLMNRPSLLVLAAALAAITTRAYAAPIYHVTDLGLGHSRGINNNGQVVGTVFVSLKNQVFLYANGTRTTIGQFNGQDTVANGIGPNGEIFGMAVSESYSLHQRNVRKHSHVWLSGWDELTRPDCRAEPRRPRHLQGRDGEIARKPRRQWCQWDRDCNGNQQPRNSGLIVGYSTATSQLDLPFLFKNGAMTDLNTLVEPMKPGWTLALAIGIHDSGWIAATGHDRPATSEHFCSIQCLSRQASPYSPLAGWRPAVLWSNAVQSRLPSTSD